MKISIFLILTTLISFAAKAYSPPASFIVSHMLKSREKLKSIELDGNITNPSEQGSIREVLHFDFVTGKIISQYFGDAGENLGTHQTKPSALSLLGRAWLIMSFDPSAVRTKAALEALGSPATETTEVKIDHRLTRNFWTWGTGNLQILKDEFVFGGFQPDVEVRDYTSKGAALMLPKTVLIKNGKFTYTLKSFKLNTQSKTPAITAISDSRVREWVELVR